MILNDVDLRTLGYRITTRTWAGLGQDLSLQNVQGRPGSIAVGMRTGPATLTVELSSIQMDHPALLAAHDALMLALRPHAAFLLRIRFPDYPDREWLGRLTSGSQFADLQRALTQRAARYTLVFTLEDPRARAVDLTQVALTNAVSVPLDLGNAASPISLAIASPSTTVRVEMQTALGLTVPGGSLVWTGNPTGEMLINAENLLLTVAGVNALAGVSRAESAFPIADPQYTLATRIKVTGATGILASYRKRWVS